MAQKKESPYVSHIFVCTNDRKGEKKSCADNNSEQVRARLKEAINDQGWKGKIRVSKSGCMGLCAKGSNVMVHPQKIWFSEVFPDDVKDILSTLQDIMSDQ